MSGSICIFTIKPFLLDKVRQSIRDCRKKCDILIIFGVIDIEIKSKNTEQFLIMA